MKGVTGSSPVGTDVAIVGGGLAGLAAAALCARAGRSVAVFEKSRQAGGRGASYDEGQFRFNLGPHALYRRGAAARLLRELNVPWTGRVPDTRGATALRAGTLHRLPAGPASLLGTGLFGFRSKLDFLRVLLRLPRLDTTALQATSLESWLGSALRHEPARGLVEALLRLSTYSNDSARLSAGAAIAQLQLALKAGVSYLDGGWRTLVEGLQRCAEAAGGRIFTGARVDSVEHDGSVRGLRLGDGTFWPAEQVILASGPSEASALIDGGGHAGLARWARESVPVRAACLNVALRRLPRPRTRFVLGVDQPIYFSVHSEWARLAPPGAATVYVMRYLSAEEPAGHDPRAELESLLDKAQPGWRQELAAASFLPSLLVANAMPLAASGGTSGRPGPEVPGVEGLHVAGDWVGPEGMLADAALASAGLAVQNLLASPRKVAA